MSISEESESINSKYTLYEEYIKKIELEKILSEMVTNLIKSQNPEPIVYMIKFLTGLLSEEKKVLYNINIPPPYPQAFPIVKYPKFKNKNILSKYLNKETWKHFKTKRTIYNNNINHLTKLSNNLSEDPIGICIVDDDCINTFDDLIENIICDVHNIQKDNLPKFNNDINSIRFCDPNEIYIINDLNDNFSEVTFEFNRNVEGYTINNISKNHDVVRKLINTEILKMKTEGFFDESFKEIYNYNYLIEKEPKIKDEIDYMEKIGFVNEYYNESDKAIFSNDNNTVMILINFSNHFKLLIKGKKENNNNLNIVDLYNKGLNIMKRISLFLEFMNGKYGYITSNISLLGNGFRIYGKLDNVNFNNLEEEIENLNFTNFKISNNSIETYQDYHLNEVNHIEFMIKFFGKFYTLLKLSKENKSIDINKLNFKEKNPIQSAYDLSFDKLKHLISPYGRNINDLLEYYKKDEKNNYPILFDKYEYYSFYPFISEYILQSQNFNINEKNHISKPEGSKTNLQLTNNEIEKLKNFTVNVYRNFSNHPFACNPFYKDNVENIENEIIKIINQINSKNNFATYYSLESKEAKKLIKDYNIPLLYDEKMKNFYINYPKNRGIIKFNFDNLFGIINDIDHFKLYCHIEKIENGEQLIQYFINIIEILNEIGREINFEFNKKFGYLTSNPHFIGNGMRIQIDLKLNNLNEEINILNENKDFKWEKINDSYIRLENLISIGISEVEMLCNLIVYIKQLIEMDGKRT